MRKQNTCRRTLVFPTQALNYIIHAGGDWCQDKGIKGLSLPILTSFHSSSATLNHEPLPHRVTFLDQQPNLGFYFLNNVHKLLVAFQHPIGHHKHLGSWKICQGHMFRAVEVRESSIFFLFPRPRRNNLFPITILSDTTTPWWSGSNYYRGNWGTDYGPLWQCEAWLLPLGTLPGIHTTRPSEHSRRLKNDWARRICQVLTWGIKSDLTSWADENQIHFTS